MKPGKALIFTTLTLWAKRYNTVFVKNARPKQIDTIAQTTFLSEQFHMTKPFW